MMDRTMRRVWRSPWTQLAFVAYSIWVATLAKHGFWYWVWIVNANYFLWVFIEKGRKRWGESDSGECEVCGKTVKFGRNSSTGARLSSPRDETRFACSKHMGHLFDLEKSRSAA